MAEIEPQSLEELEDAVTAFEALVSCLLLLRRPHKRSYL